MASLACWFKAGFKSATFTKSQMLKETNLCWSFICEGEKHRVSYLLKGGKTNVFLRNSQLNSNEIAKKYFF